MKDIAISPRKLKGEIMVPASKSLCHRAVICGGLSEGTSNLENVFFSQDIEATCEAMKSIGVQLSIKGNLVNINGVTKGEKKHCHIQCFESGSTLRFLIPIVAALGQEATFMGKGKLVERPLEPYYEIFKEQGIEYKNLDGKLPLYINGQLNSGEYLVRGDISSQFISGLLFALPLLNGDSKITLTTKLESKPYVDLTIDMLKKFSIKVGNINYKQFIIKGNQKYKAFDYKVEGDFSQAAFWLVAGTIGGEICCGGLSFDSLQGDKNIINIIEAMGGKIFLENSRLKAIPSKTRGIIIDASEYPDLVPILAVLGALSEGVTEIINAKRLRLKESDRLTAIKTELKKIGADIEEKEDGLIIRGKAMLKGGIVEGWNDHRIVMALAVASIRCEHMLVIKGADSIKKSYPDFWSDFKKLGGDMSKYSLEG